VFAHRSHRCSSRESHPLRSKRRADYCYGTNLGTARRQAAQARVDTAATQTHVVPEFLDEIGYGPQHGDRITSITSAIGDEPGYMMPVFSG